MTSKRGYIDCCTQAMLWSYLRNRERLKGNCYIQHHLPRVMLLLASFASAKWDAGGCNMKFESWLHHSYMAASGFAGWTGHGKAAWPQSWSSGKDRGAVWAETYLSRLAEKTVFIIREELSCYLFPHPLTITVPELYNCSNPSYRKNTCFNKRVFSSLTPHIPSTFSWFL